MRTAAIFPANRIVRGAVTATLSRQFTDADGDPADPTTGGATVTVSVVRSDGTAVTTGAVSGTGDGPRQASVAFAELAVTDWLTVSWALDGTVVAAEAWEVVGGTLGSIATLKALDSSLGVTSDPDLRRARKAVTDTVQSELGRAPFERFYTERLDGTGSSRLWLTWPDLREVVWARIYTDVDTFTALTADELAAIPAGIQPVAERVDGKCWPCGRRNIELGYRFGMPAVPQELSDNLVLAIRHHLALFESGVPFQAETIRTVDGVVMSVARPGVGMSITGNDEVDAAIRRHSFERPMVA